jgi:hypothetical protein
LVGLNLDLTDDELAALVRLIVWCRDCQHQVEPDPAAQAARYGAADASAPMARPAGVRLVWEPARRHGSERDRAPPGTRLIMAPKSSPKSAPGRLASKKLDQLFLETSNRTKVSPELLFEVLQMHSEMSPEDRPVFEVRVIRIYELLKSKGLRSERIADLGMAIDFRLTALARLHQVDSLRGWSIPGEKPGVVSIAFELLQAAAEEPLIENAEKQAAFDPESFRRRLLTITEPDGRHELVRGEAELPPGEPAAPGCSQNIRTAGERRALLAWTGARLPRAAPGS